MVRTRPARGEPLKLFAERLVALRTERDGVVGVANRIGPMIVALHAGRSPFQCPEPPPDRADPPATRPRAMSKE